MNKDQQEPLRAIFYDTETTGIKASTERIVELAAYDMHLDTSFVTLINPQIPIPEPASAVHHITDDMVKESPTFAQVFEDFEKFCSGNVVLIAHNNDNFDIHFLREELKRIDKTLPTSWQFLDSLKWARKYRSDLPQHKLQFLREVYDIKANNAHRALDDVHVLKEVFLAMTGNLPIEKVIALMKEQSDEFTMPFGKFQGRPLQEVPTDYVKWLKKSGAFDKAENQNLKQQFEQIGALS